MTITATAYATALVDYLIDVAVLDPSTPVDRNWARGLHEVPRALFVPPRAWAQPMDDRDEHLIDQRHDRYAWWNAVYSNTAIITQRGDGDADVANTQAAATSSLSCPYVAMQMLRMLDVTGHHRVLEIGTGTGWTAAMLAWRLGGAGQVVTVEIDEMVAAHAEVNLLNAGYPVKVITRDGAAGHPGAAPYDRVHVTCGVTDIPHTWVEQTRPGGIIVAPWMAKHGQCGELLRLDVLPDGSATGRFIDSASFMMMRSQRQRQSWPPYQGEGAESRTRFDPRTIPPAWTRGFGLHLAAHAPHIMVTGTGWEDFGGDATWVMRLREADGDGWALACVQPDKTDTEVFQGGDRLLWAELQDTYTDWLMQGSPGRRKFRLQVTRDSQQLMLI